jgi:DNA-binding NarL/FixJ family response regulator
MKIKIIIADDHKILRQGLKTLLEQHDEFQVIGEAENGDELVKLTKKLMPDIVVLDIGMPVMNGIQAAHHISKNVPKTKMIALSMHSDQQYVIKMLQAGASSYILKDCAFEELIDAVHDVILGKVYLGKDIIGEVVTDYAHKLRDGDFSDSSVLTSREIEILRLISEGKKTIETAKILNISAKTVESHRRNIMDKLDINSIAGLTKHALREGLTTLEE